MIVDKINQYLSSADLKIDDYIAGSIGSLAKYAFTKQFMTESESKPQALWMSDAGKCPRQVAYRYHGIEKAGKEIDSRAKIIFFQGDLVELMITTLARLAGCNIMATGLNQLHVSIPFKKEIPFSEPEDVLVTGRPDGILIDGGDTCLVEVKSMSSFSFARFEQGEIDNSYRTQCTMYLSALGLKRCLIIALNKDNGIMSEQLIGLDKSIFMEGVDTFKQVLASTPDELPEPKYHANDKGLYPWNCLYCQWWKVCWKDEAEQVVVGKAYKLKKKGEENGK